jgi:glutamyl-tRNA(Gln) amidotransferase subunit E
MDKTYGKELGFKCGLEIHQRLLTKEKLFCACASSGESPELPIHITRKQRAVAGEMGAIDPSTKFESTRQRTFVYNTFLRHTCLVDIDEEPPHGVNAEALEIALKICAALHAEVPDEIEPMRKEVVDGSDPSAFQRTLLVGYNGYVDVEGRRIGIPAITLEEESGGIEGSSEFEATYNIDRLGVPLIEIDTDPTISSPAEAKKTALAIGALLRLTFGVQRGIGTIRQDVNISIAEGSRVEVKGVQEVDIMDAMIECEVERQERLIQIRKELALRKAKVHGCKEITRVMEHTEATIIKNEFSAGNGSGAVYGIRAEGFEGIVGMEINPARRLGSEISDYAKMGGVKGIMHSDEDLPGYGFTTLELEIVKKELTIESGDAFILVASRDRKTAKRSAELAARRAEMALHGVPAETRTADSTKGITRFARPLPGGSRMYPETDSKPIRIDATHYSEIMKDAPDIAKESSRLSAELGNGQIAMQMLKSPMLQTYRFILLHSKARPLVVATILLEKLKELHRDGIEIEVSDSVLVHIFNEYAEGRITRQGIEEILKSSPSNSNDVDKAISDKHLKRIKGKELADLLKGLGLKRGHDAVREVMSRYRANVDGEELNSLVGG